MKKLVILTAVALSLVSGITAVSAYEGHMVDVRAHVENALMVETYDVDFGITFPEEVVYKDFRIGLSESFRGQQVFGVVEYALFWEEKPIGEHKAIDPDDNGLFEDIYPFTNVTVDGDLQPKVLPGSELPAMFGRGTLDLNPANPDECDVIGLSFDPPVFDHWYNEATDPRIPSGVLLIESGDYDTAEETAPCGDWTAWVPHADLGNNLKIQVMDILTVN
jgi:hypothetical protein